MDLETINTITGIIGSIVGIIGTIVGIIGAKCLSQAVKIKNNAKAGDNSHIQQAQIMNIGMDSYAVIRLSRETTKEELEKLIANIHPVVWEELDDAVTEKMKKTNDDVSRLNERLDKMPKIHVGAEEPADSKEGDIWFKPV